MANFTFNITQAPAFVAMGGSPTIACGASATLNAVVSGGFSPYTYAWPGGTIGNSLVVQPTSATIYDLEVTDACGNEATATFNVDLLAPAPLNMTVQGQNSVTEACTTANINLGRPQGAQGPLTVELSFAGSATPGVDYEMSPQQLIPEGSSNIVLVFEAVEDGQAEDGEEAVITASFTDQCGRTVTSTVTLTILDAPLINIASNSNETVPCSLDSIPLVAMAEGGVGSLTYSWNTGVLGPVAYAGSLVGGTYIVTATDACGRSASASTTISVDCDIVVPNVFTPNNDGTNDRFEIEGILSAKNTVKVFNRWGQVVFEANNYRNNWAATGLPEGTYFYEVVVEGHEKPYTGDLTIMRN